MTRKLKISQDLTFPVDVITQRLAVLGRTGSGKSSTATVVTEEVIKIGQQAVVLTPKCDWWGIRSSADGKGPGLPVTIFGGEKGDVPLDPMAGSLIADIIVNERISAVIDLSNFESENDEVRFSTEFADRLFRKNRSPMLFVIDECDFFMPQFPEPNERKMLNRFQRICRRGRTYGIGVMMISQRSAAVHKGCLGQTEVMIAHQTTSPQDRKALGGWTEGKGTLEQQKKFMESLASLKVGEAVVWSPAWLDIFKSVQVRKKETYDSSATPKVGVRRRQPKVLARVDIDRLKKHMAETIERMRSEDPGLLREEIIRLQKEVRDLKARHMSKAEKVPPSKPEIKTEIKERIVEVPVIGKRGIRRLEKMVERIEKARSHFSFSTQALEIATRSIQATISKMSGRSSAGLPPLKKKEAASVKPEPVKPVIRKTPIQSNGDGKAPDKCGRAILGVLAQYSEGCDIDKIALLSGYRQSGSFKTTLSALRTGGFIEGQNAGTMKITEVGREALGNDYTPLPVGKALADYWLRHPSFALCERKVLESLLGSRDGLTIEEICGETGYQASGSLKTSLSSLRTAGVLVGKNSEKMKAADDLR